MDDHKVKAILDWEPPRLVPALRSFLGLASYYYKFIKNFAKIAAPLTNVLKKSSRTYDWDEICDEAFETLKGILVKTIVVTYEIRVFFESVQKEVFSNIFKKAL
jgi:hypothetical protein